MGESFRFCPLQGRLPARCRDLAIGQIIPTANDSAARNFNQIHCFSFTRLKTDGGSRWNVEPFSVSLSAIESKRRIGFNEMVMAADLNRAISQVRDRQGRTFATRV